MIVKMKYLSFLFLEWNVENNIIYLPVDVFWDVVVTDDVIVVVGTVVVGLGVKEVVLAVGVVVETIVVLSVAVVFVG